MRDEEEVGEAGDGLTVVEMCSIYLVILLAILVNVPIIKAILKSKIRFVNLMVILDCINAIFQTLPLLQYFW